MLLPGETVRHTFAIPFHKGDISKVIVSYKYGYDVFLEKTIVPKEPTTLDQYIKDINDCPDVINMYGEDYITQNDIHSVVSYVLEQDETLLIPTCGEISIQMNILTTGLSRHTSTLIWHRTGPQHLTDTYMKSPIHENN